MSALEIASLAAKSGRPLMFGFINLEDALRVGEQLVRLPGGLQGTKFYLKFGGRVGLEEADRLRALVSAGVDIIWDPDIGRNLAVMGGVQYAVEKDGLRALGQAKVQFSKAGFFDTIRAKAVRAQKLGEASGFAAMLVLERGERLRYPLFVCKETLPRSLRSGDTIEAAYLSIVSERTVSGWHAPAEVFMEALAIRLLHSSPGHPSLPWMSAREVIDRVLSGIDKPPSAGGKKAEAWQRAATAAVQLALKKDLVYLDSEDERYMYREIRGRAAESARKTPELRR